MAERAGRVLIIANLEKESAESVADSIAVTFTGLGVESENYFYQGDPDGPPKTEGVDLVVSLGGDGTVLYAARVAAPLGIPILPINLGRLGFIAEISVGEWPSAIAAWMRGDLPVSERLMLAVEAWREGHRVASFCAMNDATVSAQGIAKLLGFGINLGESTLVRYRADGVIVATPTGSTAYNLAAGGPVLHPEMEAMIVNPVCPFTLSNRPLVVPANEAVEITMEEGRRTGAMLTIDGQETFTLRSGDRICVSGGPKKARIHVSKGFAFYELLRSKLAWSGGPGA
ncbi:MAG: NAD(+)/NADH kinase [Rectinemataceae bacterium]|jgi:NAD+ kinase